MSSIIYEQVLLKKELRVDQIIRHLTFFSKVFCTLRRGSKRPQEIKKNYHVKKCREIQVPNTF